MADKKFLPGILVIALVFTTAIIGCSNGTIAEFDDDDFYLDDDSGGITYTVEADGVPDKDTSTKLIFKFDEPVSGLKVDNITIIDSNTTGKAKKNTRGAAGSNFTGSGKEWTLNITNVTAGNIRVKITKEGIERGRKTVTVFQDNSTGEESDQAIKLTNALWQGGHLDDGEQVLWYKFEAEKGKEYRVHLKVSGSVFIQVTAYKSDGTTPIEDFFEVSLYEPIPISGQSGTVYLKAELVNVPYFGYLPGSFEIRFYDPTDMGPQDIIEIYEATATLELSVLIKWSARAAEGEGSIESKGYRVFRSDTEDGTYEQIAEIPTSSIYYHVDLNLPPGKSYWYKVAGYNTKGEGELSEPRKSGFVADVDSAKVLTFGKLTKGELTGLKTEDWYKFTAESGKTYTVQCEYSANRPDYTAYFVDVSVLKSDKTPISDFIVDYYTDYSGTISGVSGTVYIRVSLINDFYGTYGIKLSQ